MSIPIYLDNSYLKMYYKNGFTQENLSSLMSCLLSEQRLIAPPHVARVTSYFFSTGHVCDVMRKMLQNLPQLPQTREALRNQVQVALYSTYQ